MKKSTFLIVGRHAVTEALKNPRRKVHRLFITEDALKKLNRENQNTNLIKKVHVFYKSKKEIDNLCGKEDISHQNIVAEIENFVTAEICNPSELIARLFLRHGTHKVAPIQSDGFAITAPFLDIFNSDAPFITSVVPGSGILDGATVVTVEGHNFFRMQIVSCAFNGTSSAGTIAGPGAHRSCGIGLLCRT